MSNGFDYSKIAVANKVLKAVTKFTIVKVAKNFSIEMYSNGREQGYMISGRNFRICFSENRNSDQIAVYWCHGVEAYTAFSMQGNSPCDEIYHRAKYFGPNEVVKAASFVYSQINHAYTDMCKADYLQKKVSV